jgi:hypothetical protein
MYASYSTQFIKTQVENILGAVGIVFIGVLIKDQTKLPIVC